MPVSSETLSKLMAAGLDSATIVDIVASIDRDMDRDRPVAPTSARPDRNRRYYESHKAEIKEKRLKASELQSSESVLKRLNSDATDSIRNPARAQVDDNLSLKEDSGKKKNLSLEDAFRRLRLAYPKRQGSDPSEPVRRKLAAFLKSGVPFEAIEAGASRYRAEQEALGKVGTPYVMQLGTWLNRRCWQDYQIVNGHDPPTEREETAEEMVARIRAENADRKKTISGS